MLNQIIILFLLTLIPTFELRVSIPFGILGGTLDLPFGLTIRGMGLPWEFVFIICVVSNIILGSALFPIYKRLIIFLQKIPFVNRLWEKILLRARKKIHVFVEKFGILGVALFIAVPLPGSGSYTGMLGAYLLGLNFKSSIIANAIGVTIAGIAVTLISVGTKGILKFLF